MDGLDNETFTTEKHPFRLRIATPGPVDGSFFKIHRRIQILPAQTDSAKEQNQTLKPYEEALVTIYLTPIAGASNHKLLSVQASMHPSC